MKNAVFLYKRPEDLVNLRRAGALSSEVLHLMCKMLTPGMTTLAVDDFAEKWIRDHHGAFPTFKGYLGFPASICISIDHEVVHGIPNKQKILKEGSVVSIDVGVTLDADGQRYIGDNAKTVVVGQTSDRVKELISDTEEALYAGIAACLPGKRISDVAAAIEKIAKQKNRGYIKEFGGHGICPEYHSQPFIPNFIDYFRYGDDAVIQHGMVLAIEPMFTFGLGQIRKLRDNWTVVTRDNKISSHVEHSIYITETGNEILTMFDEAKK